MYSEGEYTAEIINETVKATFWLHNVFGTKEVIEIVPVPDINEVFPSYYLSRAAIESRLVSFYSAMYVGRTFELHISAHPDEFENITIAAVGLNYTDTYDSYTLIFYSKIQDGELVPQWIFGLSNFIRYKVDRKPICKPGYSPYNVDYCIIEKIEYVECPKEPRKDKAKGEPRSCKNLVGNPINLEGFSKKS